MWPPTWVALTGPCGNAACAMRVCKKVVSSFSYSWKKIGILQRHKQLNLAHTPLGQNVQPDLLKPIPRYFLHCKSSDISPSLGRTLMYLRPSISGDKYLSVNFLKPTLHLSSNSILEVQEDDTGLVKSIKQKIVDSVTHLNDKYTDTATQEILDKACALDQTKVCQWRQTDSGECLITANVIIIIKGLVN